MRKHPGPWRHLMDQVMRSNCTTRRPAPDRRRVFFGFTGYENERRRSWRETAQQQQANGKRAAIYSRVSDKSQDGEDKTSISEQTSEMEAYCEGKGLTITAHYQEVGRGWSKKRPEFQRMLTDARSGRFDTIVCWKSDRLSRGMYPAAALMEVVEAHQIHLEAVMDAIDMKTFGLMAAIGKIELDNFRERASMGKRGAAKWGRIPTSKVPYGYTIAEDGTPQVNQEKAQIVRRIYHRYIHDGMGARAIARQLDEDEVPPGTPGKQWHDSQVQRILRNETYKGTWWYGKARHVSTDDGTKVYEQPKDAWVGVPFPPIVDDETWERVQSLRKQRWTPPTRNTKAFYLLQHMVRCAECGMLFGCRTTRRQTVKYNGKVYKYDLDPPRRYYRCYGVQKFRLNCRNRSYIRAERLEELVWGQVKRVVQDRDLLIAGIDALDTSEDGEMAKQVARTERDLQNIQLEEDRAIRLYVSGKVTESQLDHQRKFITERLENLRAKLDDYRARESAEVERRVLMEYVLEWAEKVGEGLDDLPSEERRDVLQILLDRVMIDRDNNVVITLGIPTEDLVAIGNPEPGFLCTPRWRGCGAQWTSTSACPLKWGCPHHSGPW